MTGYDAIVTNAAGCGSHLKDHGSARVVDVSELLAEAPTPAERHPLPISVAFQDSCHLKHAQRIADEPRATLRAIPGLTILEPAEQDLCCGSAGIYNLVQPDAATELGEPEGSIVSSRPSPTPTRAATRAASCRSPRRCGARDVRCRRSIRSSSSTRRSAASTPSELLAIARR